MRRGVNKLDHLQCTLILSTQCAEEVVSVSLGPVDFAVRLMSSVLNLPEGQVTFFWEYKSQKSCNQSCSLLFFVLVEMIFGLVRGSYSLSVCQAVKLLFLFTWFLSICFSSSQGTLHPS